MNKGDLEERLINFAVLIIEISNEIPKKHRNSPKNFSNRKSLLLVRKSKSKEE